MGNCAGGSITDKHMALVSSTLSNSGFKELREGLKLSLVKMAHSLAALAIGDEILVFLAPRVLFLLKRPEYEKFLVLFEPMANKGYKFQKVKVTPKGLRLLYEETPVLSVVYMEFDSGLVNIYPVREGEDVVLLDETALFVGGWEISVSLPENGKRRVVAKWEEFPANSQ